MVLHGIAAGAGNNFYAGHLRQNPLHKEPGLLLGLQGQGGDAALRARIKPAEPEDFAAWAPPEGDKGVGEFLQWAA
ncbi:MAG: hypothetical protein JRC69_08060 [Deltaproteobacteria bacterium]|nr:hypothetical protein [Deltaproteobacteria bacterium]